MPLSAPMGSVSYRSNTEQKTLGIKYIKQLFEKKTFDIFFVCYVSDTEAKISKFLYGDTCDYNSFDGNKNAKSNVLLSHGK